MSGALLLYRDAGPARSLSSHTPSLIRTARQAEFEPGPSTSSGLNVDPSEVIAGYFTCDPTKVDLSYYGIFQFFY